MSKKSFHDRKSVALALRAARKAAGFKSASEAAAQHGFGHAKFRSQEAGARAVSALDAAQYARAFGIPVEDLLKPNPQIVRKVLRTADRSERLNREQAKKQKKQTARRLKIARVAAGHETASSAADAFGLILPTYLGHENGKNALSVPIARLYAEMFGVNENWLLTGELPSGLGRLFDARVDLETAPDDYAALRHLVDRRSRPSKTRIESLKTAVRAVRRPAWTENSGDVLRQISLSELREGGIEGLATTMGGYWPLPKGFVRRSFNASVEDMIVAFADESVGSISMGERLFIDTSRTDVRQRGEFLLIENGKLLCVDSDCSSNGRPRASVIGKIVAKFVMIE